MGVSSEAKQRNAVVFPAPFGPSSAYTSPGLDAQGDPVDRVETAIRLGETLELDHGRDRMRIHTLQATLASVGDVKGTDTQALKA